AVSRRHSPRAQGSRGPQTAHRPAAAFADESAGARAADRADTDRYRRLAAGRGGPAARPGGARAGSVGPPRERPEQADGRGRPPTWAGTIARRLSVGRGRRATDRNEEERRGLRVVRGQAASRTCGPQVARDTADAARLALTDLSGCPDLNS